MMQSQKRQQKICWNCEGAVSVEALYCPYCGSDMQTQIEMQPELEPLQESPHYHSKTQVETSNLASLYKPPYSPNQRGFGVPNFKEEKPLQEDFYHPEEQVIYEHKQESSSKEEATPRIEIGLWPLLFLSIGMNLLTLGLLLFFFSDKGMLILQWNSYYWFVYCILSIPLLMFGWKLLHSQHPSEEE